MLWFRKIKGNLQNLHIFIDKYYFKKSMHTNLLNSILKYIKSFNVKEIQMYLIYQRVGCPTSLTPLWRVWDFQVSWVQV